MASLANGERRRAREGRDAASGGKRTRGWECRSPSLTPDPYPLPLSLVRAALGVQALFGHAQAFHRPAAHQMFTDNFGRIFYMHIAIPDGFRVNDHHRPVLALVQATGLVDAHPRTQSGFPLQSLQFGV